MSNNLRILFAGSGEFGLPALRLLRQSGHELVHIITQPDRPSGRGRHTLPTPVAQWALDNNLPLLRTANINAESLPPADLLVVIAFGQKISPAVTAHPTLGSINLHASLLPKYRGAAPINWAIARGETVTGNSVIRLAPKMVFGSDFPGLPSVRENIDSIRGLFDPDAAHRILWANGARLLGLPEDGPG